MAFIKLCPLIYSSPPSIYLFLFSLSLFSFFLPLLKEWKVPLPRPYRSICFFFFPSSLSVRPSFSSDISLYFSFSTEVNLDTYIHVSHVRKSQVSRTRKTISHLGKRSRGKGDWEEKCLFFTLVIILCGIMFVSWRKTYG